MKKLSIAAALLFAFGTFAFAQDAASGKAATTKKGTAAKTEKKTAPAKGEKKAAPAKKGEKKAAPAAADKK